MDPISISSALSFSLCFTYEEAINVPGLPKADTGSILSSHLHYVHVNSSSHHLPSHLAPFGAGLG